MKALKKIQANYFCLEFDALMLWKYREIIRENAFQQKKKKPELKFNPGLARRESKKVVYDQLNLKINRKYISKTSRLL